MELMEFLPFLIIAALIVGYIKREDIKKWLAGRKDKE